MTKAEQILDKHSKTIPLHPNAALAAMKEIAELAFQAGEQREYDRIYSYSRTAPDQKEFINNQFNQQL